jgi:hypothetical protein
MKNYYNQNIYIAMNKFLLLSISLLLLVSCSSISVNSDYDKKLDFSQYKTFAFYKSGIDKVEISDLDKKRILKSIEETMTAKGFTISESPDLLINIYFKRKRTSRCKPIQYGLGIWLESMDVEKQYLCE